MHRGLLVWDSKAWLCPCLLQAEPHALRALSMLGRFKAVQRHTVLTRAEPAGTHHRPTEAPVLSDKSLLVSSSLGVHHNEPD